MHDINSASLNSTGVLKKLKIEQPYDPAIPLLSIYLEKDEYPNLKRDMHPSVHCNITDNSHDMEAT